MLGNLIYYGASLIFVLVYLPMLVNIIKAFVDTVAGYLELKKMGNGSYQEIRLGDVSYNETKHINLIIRCLLAIVLVIICLKLCIGYSNIGLTVGFCEMIAAMVLEVIIFVIRYSHGTDAYLTPVGIVSAEGIYTRGECRFAVEADASAGSRKYINVYKGEAAAPVRFMVLEREEEVLERVNLM